MRATDSPGGGVLETAPRIWGKYRLAGRIDVGDQRLVYRGVEVASGRQVALEIFAKPALDASFDDRLNDVVAAFARARSSHLATVHEHGVTQDGTRFIAMAPLLGQSLAARLKAQRRLPVVEAVQIACGVAEALAALHAQGAVYGALEPSRVFLVPEARGGHRVRLLVGVARAPNASVPTLSGRNSSDQRSGTYLAGGDALHGFSSPEQLRRAPSVAADIFSLGALVYALIAGSPPFERDTLAPEPSPLEPLARRVRDVRVPAALDAALARALAFDPEARPRSVVGLGQELRAALGLATTPAGLPDPGPLLGTTIGGRYRLESYRGKDREELSFRALAAPSGAEVNVAVFTAVGDAERELGERLSSADRMRGNAASGLVAVLDRGYLPDGCHYVVTEPWDETLADRLRRQQLFAPEAAVVIVREVADALDLLHARGEVHRELDPANVVFSGAESAKPRLRLVSAPRRKQIDAAAHDIRPIFGSPEYASPEEASSGWIGVRSNVYSLGVIAYEMLTGTPPFVDGSVFCLLRHHLASSPEAPSQRAPGAGFPREWDEPILRALAKQASARFVSAGDFADELEFALVSAPPAPASGFAPAAAATTEASVVVPLVRTRSQAPPAEPSVVVPLTRLAGNRNKDEQQQTGEEALPLLRATAIPLITPRPRQLFTIEPDRPSRDWIKVLVLLIAIGGVAAALWLGARYLY